MTIAAAAIRKQLAEPRALVAAATQTSASIEQDEGSVVWAERVSGLALDLWQRDVLTSDDARLAILCCRQSGKSTVVALKAADLVRRGGMAMVIAPSLRQSSCSTARSTACSSPAARLSGARRRPKSKPCAAASPCTCPATDPTCCAGCRCAGRTPRF
jgi:hypothetical protein